MGFINKIKNTSKKILSSIGGVSKTLMKDKISDIVTASLNTYRSLACPENTRILQRGELHYGCHNFTGPGTVLDNGGKDMKPYNNIDNCSRTHDIDYENAEKYTGEERAKKIFDADIRAVKCYDNYKNESGYFAAKNAINAKNKIEGLIKIITNKNISIYG